MHDMLDPDDRRALGVDRADCRDQRLAFALGQAAGDLVQQQELGIGRQGTRELQPLAVDTTNGIAQKRTNAFALAVDTTNATATIWLD